MDLDLTDTDQERFLLPTLLHSFFLIRTTKFGPEAQVVLTFSDFWVEDLFLISFNSAIPKISYFQ